MIRLLDPRDVDRLRAEPFSYSPVGATATSTYPQGFHRLSERAHIGDGRAAFDRAAERLITWRMHEGAGLRVAAEAERVAEGVVVVCRLGPLRIPCRVVWVLDEPDRAGFGYGTLPGHPEAGEEAFVVELKDDAVHLTVTAYSRPGRWFTRLGGPVGRALQRRVIRRYADALRD